MSHHSNLTIKSFRQVSIEIDFLIIFFTLKIDKFLTGITLSTHKDERCAGYNVSFEVVQNGIICKTVPKEVEKNVLSTWTYLQLGECMGTPCDGNVDTIQFKMKTDLDDDFCSKEIVMDINHDFLYESDFTTGTDTYNTAG